MAYSKFLECGPAEFISFGYTSSYDCGAHSYLRDLAAEKYESKNLGLSEAFHGKIRDVLVGPPLLLMLLSSSPTSVKKLFSE